jgi:hypothetical protein
MPQLPNPEARVHDSHRLSRSAGLSVGLGRNFGLGWPPSRPLARHHRAAQDEFATPYAPRFLALQGTREAGDPRCTPPAHGLGCLHVLGGLSEEQVWILGARQHGPGTRYRHEGPGRHGRSHPLRRRAGRALASPGSPYAWYGLRFQPRRARCNGGGGGPVHVDPLISRRSCRSGLRRSREPDKYLRPRTRFGSAAFWGSRPVFLDRIPSRMRTRLAAADGGDTGHFLVLLAGDLLNGDIHRVICLRPRPSKDTTGAGGQRDVCGHTGALCARSKRPGAPMAGSLAKKHAVAQCGHLLPQGVVGPPLTCDQPR